MQLMVATYDHTMQDHLSQKSLRLPLLLAVAWAALWSVAYFVAADNGSGAGVVLWFIFNFPFSFAFYFFYLFFASAAGGISDYAGLLAVSTISILQGITFAAIFAGVRSGRIRRNDGHL